MHSPLMRCVRDQACDARLVDNDFVRRSTGLVAYDGIKNEEQQPERKEVNQRFT